MTAQLRIDSSLGLLKGLDIMPIIDSILDRLKAGETIDIADRLQGVDLDDGEVIEKMTVRFTGDTIRLIDMFSRDDEGTNTIETRRNAKKKWRQTCRSWSQKGGFEYVDTDEPDYMPYTAKAINERLCLATEYEAK